MNPPQISSVILNFSLGLLQITVLWTLLCVYWKHVFLLDTYLGVEFEVIVYNNGTPLQYSCLENPMDGGAWWAAVRGVTKSRTRLSDFTVTFHFHALEQEMATHSSVLAWRIPGTGEPGGLPSMGSHRVGHDWSDWAAAYTISICLSLVGNGKQFSNMLCKFILMLEAMYDNSFLFKTHVSTWFCPSF